MFFQVRLEAPVALKSLLVTCANISESPPYQSKTNLRFQISDRCLYPAFAAWALQACHQSQHLTRSRVQIHSGRNLRDTVEQNTGDYEVVWSFGIVL